MKKNTSVLSGKGNLRDEVHRKAKTEAKKSWAWFENNVRNAAAGMSAQKFLGDNHAVAVKTVSPGSMIQYFYDPKTKDKLPYYDTFPLLLPFDVDGIHFSGINMHYLHPVTRAMLLQTLMKFVDDDSLSHNAKLNITWKTLKGVSMFPDVKHSVKKYLFSQVKSNFIQIPPNEWEYVIWLPLEKFKKASAETVWSNR